MKAQFPTFEILLYVAVDRMAGQRFRGSQILVKQ
jgi:hypothetical protein